MLLAFGAIAVASMLLFYALEHRHARYVLGFAVASAAAAVYGYATDAWPFAAIESVWALVALRRWQQRRLPPASRRRSDVSPPIAYACNMDAFTPRQRDRHLELIHAHLLGARIDEQPGGLRFRFPADPDRYTGLAEWITLERLCCPWIAFGLDLHDDAVELRLSAPAEAQGVLREEFAPLLQAGPGA